MQLTPLQWRRQNSKGARSFRGQKTLEPGHPDVAMGSPDLRRVSIFLSQDGTFEAFGTLLFTVYLLVLEAKRGFVCLKNLLEIKIMIK